MDNRYIATQQQLNELNFWRGAFKLNTCIPAIVDEFNVATQRVSATPAIQAKYITPDGEVKYIDCPKITNIPLAIIKSPGLKLTYPVKKGQNCTLIFSQRSIDNFLLDGSKPYPPTEGPDPLTSSLRCMDMTDALCFPGLITNNETISSYNNDAIEIRSADGTTKVSVAENTLNFIQGGGSITMSGGKVEITASEIKINGKTTISGSDVEISGKTKIDGSNIDITGTTTINNHDFDTHKHSGVTAGTGNTGVVV